MVLDFVTCDDVCVTRYCFHCFVWCTRVELRLIALRRPRIPGANRTAAVRGSVSCGIDTYVAPAHHRPRDRGVWSMAGSKATAFAALYILCSTSIRTRSFACVLFVWWPTKYRRLFRYQIVNELPHCKNGKVFRISSVVPMDTSRNDY